MNYRRTLTLFYPLVRVLRTAAVTSLQSQVNKNEIVAHYTTEEADASQPQSEKNVVVNGQLDSFSFDELYKHHSFKKTQYKAARKTITSLHLNHH